MLQSEKGSCDVSNYHITRLPAVVQSSSSVKQTYNLTMPCEEYERLKRDWTDKERTAVRLCMGGYGRSIKRTLAERESANTQRIVAETHWMNHIKSCALCQSEGKKAWEVDPHPPNY